MSLFTSLLLGLLQGAPQDSRETPREEFRRIGEELYSNENPFVGTGMRRLLEKGLAAPGLPLEKRVEFLVQLAKEELKFIELEAAIARLEGLLAELGPGGPKALRLRVHRQLALAYLRLAEQENCVARHNAECCIFPLEGGGRHEQRAPAEKAREHYLALLELAPGERDALWLLNLAAMALGQYPDGVPERLRLPERAFASEAKFPRFKEVAQELGAKVFAMAGGVAVEDYDGDGRLDILTSTCDPLGALTHLRQKEDGTFEDVSVASGVDEQLGGLNLISGDPDNDGDWDALVLRGAWLLDYGLIRRSLLRNEAGSFTDVTREVGLAEPAFPTQTATFADFDADGWLDLYVGHESRAEMEPGAPNYPSQLFRNREGRFENVTRAAGVANDRYAKGVAAGDADNDGDLDLFVSNIGLNRLYQNRGDGTFVDVAREARVTGKSERHFACWFFDLDQDGWLDLWVSGYQTRLDDLASHALGEPFQAAFPMVFGNRRDGTFVDRAAELGLTRPWLPMGANFGDLDNDGWLDVYLATGEPALQVLVPNVMLWNRGGERFLDVTHASGTGHLQKGHGVAFADLDGDGDQDLFNQLGGFFPVDRFHSALFRNPGFGNHWLTLELVGTRSSRCATGARLTLELETPAGVRTLHRAHGMVSSYGGSPHRQDIGLGDATRVVRLTVRWPRTQEPQVFPDLPLDAHLRLVEGEPAPVRLR